MGGSGAEIRKAACALWKIGSAACTQGLMVRFVEGRCHSMHSRAAGAEELLLHQEAPPAGACHTSTRRAQLLSCTGRPPPQQHPPRQRCLPQGLLLQAPSRRRELRHRLADLGTGSRYQSPGTAPAEPEGKHTASHWGRAWACAQHWEPPLGRTWAHGDPAGQSFGQRKVGRSTL